MIGENLILSTNERGEARSVMEAYSTIQLTGSR